MANDDPHSIVGSKVLPEEQVTAMVLRWSMSRGKA